MCCAVNACVIACNENISQQKCPNIEPQKFFLANLQKETPFRVQGGDF